MHKCTALRIVSYPIIPSYLCNIFSQYYESVSEARPDGSSAASLLRQTGKRTPERQSEPCTQKPSPTDRSNRCSEVGLYRSPLCIQDQRFPYGRHPRIHRPPFSPTDPLFYDTALLPYRSNGSGRTNISSSSWKTAYLAGTDEIHLYSAPSGNFLCTWNLYKSNRADR